MKKHFTKLCVALVAVLFFASCNSDEKQIKTVVLNYTKAMVEADFGKAKEFATPETVKLLDMVAGFVGQDPQAIEKAKEEAKNVTFEVTEVKLIDKDNAEAVISTENSKKTDEGKKTETVKLKKIDGKWFVHQPKEGGNDEPMQEEETVEEEVAVDTTVAAK